MARPQAIKLGPFTGGLNTAVDPVNLEDNELSECINFEVDIDGSLVCRPPIQETTNFQATAGNSRLKVIGRGRFSSGGSYIFASNSTGTYAFDGVSWSTVDTVLQSNAVVQYNDKAYFIPIPGTKSTQPGGFWDPVGGFTDDANMPEGMAALSHKSRIFVVPGTNTSTNPSRLQFTDVITSTTLSWPGINFIDVSPGDNSGSLTDLVVYNDNLILTKDNAIYVLAYDVSPADAVLRIVNDRIGTAIDNCLTTYENSIFLFNEGSVYEMTNYEFKNISQNMDFEYDPSLPTGGTSWADPVFLKVMGDRLFLRFYNKMYVLNLLTRSWSEWFSNNENLNSIGPMVELANDNNPAEIDKAFYMGSAITNDYRIFKILENHTETDTESVLPATEVDITCSLRTKEFTFDAPFVYKRLTWWNGQILSKNDVQSALYPEFKVTNSTWEDIGAFNWDELNGTWGSIFSNDLVSTVPAVAVVKPRLYKFLKSIRFKNLSFAIVLTDDGSSLQGPCRVFELAAIVGSKQVVEKSIN